MSIKMMFHTCTLNTGRLRPHEQVLGEPKLHIETPQMNKDAHTNTEMRGEVPTRAKSWL